MELLANPSTVGVKASTDGGAWDGARGNDTIAGRCKDGKGHEDTLGRGDMVTLHGSPCGLGPGEGQTGGRGGPVHAFSHPLTPHSADTH